MLILSGAFGIVVGVALLVTQREKGLPPGANLPGWNTEMEWRPLATLETTIYAETAGVILLVAGLYPLQRLRSPKTNPPST